MTRCSLLYFKECDFVLNEQWFNLTICSGSSGPSLLLCAFIVFLEPKKGAGKRGACIYFTSYL
jgi:hypothetical protein